MTSLTKSTKSVKERQVVREWHLVNAKNKVLGRIVGTISRLLQGKHKVNYVPYLDLGDYVIVINTKDVKVTGNKGKSKMYTRYSGYPGGLKQIPYNELFRKNPREVIRHAASGMLPKNKFRKDRLTRLFVFLDEKHPYSDKLKGIPL